MWASALVCTCVRNRFKHGLVILWQRWQYRSCACLFRGRANTTPFEGTNITGIFSQKKSRLLVVQVLLFYYESILCVYLQAVFCCCLGPVSLAILLVTTGTFRWIQRVLSTADRECIVDVGSRAFSRSAFQEGRGFSGKSKSSWVVEYFISFYWYAVPSVVVSCSCGYPMHD